MPAPVVDVVIPALNEEASLPLVLADLGALPAGTVRRVVVADNGSEDGTARVAREGGALVVDAPRPGYGSACLAGLAWLREHDPPEVVVFLDADYSDHPEELPRVVAPVARREADLVIGSRVLGEREPGALLPQARAGNVVACLLIRVLYGHRFTDLGPFRAIRWSALERLGMADPDFGWTAEMQVKALRHGLRVTEVPVSYRRRVGVSKITGTVKGTVLAGYKILWTVLRHAAARREGPGSRVQGSGPPHPVRGRRQGGAMTREVTVDVEVRYAETDQMGVVHHATYVIWFELARTALCAETGHHYADIERLGYLLMVTGVEVRFLRPARYGDTVQVTCRLDRLGSRGMRFGYRVTRDGEDLVSGATEHLWVAKATGRPCRMPEVLRPGFQALAEPGDPAAPRE